MSGKFFARKNLYLRVAAGFVIGIVLGFAAPGFSMASRFVGDAYLGLLRFMIIPVVICAVFCSIANIRNTAMLRRLGLRTVGLYILMFVASCVVSLAVVYAIRPGLGMSLGSDVVFDQQPADTSISGFLGTIIPSGFFRALVDGNTLPVIIFTAIFAVAVVSVGEKGRSIINLMNGVSDAVFTMLGWFMELSPLGVMSLMASSVAGYGGVLFGTFAKYIACCWLCCIVTYFLVMMLPACTVTGVSPSRFLKACSRIALVTMSTTSSAAALPTTISVSINYLGAPVDISNFTLPLGCTINMCGGACSFCCLAVFTADVYGISLSFGTVVAMVLAATLMNMAAPGIPGGGIVLGASFLSMFGLPFDVMALIGGFYRLLDMAFTTINVMGDVSANLLISKSVTSR